jgi:hypothetical protein
METAELLEPPSVKKQHYEAKKRRAAPVENLYLSDDEYKPVKTCTCCKLQRAAGQISVHGVCTACDGNYIQLLYNSPELWPMSPRRQSAQPIQTLPQLDIGVTLEVVTDK